MENAKLTIMVVDDEEDIRSIIRFNLERAGYEVSESAGGAAALKALRGGLCVNLLLLDVMMPDIDGFEVARQLRANDTTGGIPIIFLTAKGDNDDVLKGFALGADDYVAKPFSLDVLLARVKAVLARTQTPAAERLRFQGLELDAQAKRVLVDGLEVACTKTEYELLRLFLSERGRVLSREELIRKAWPDDVLVSERTVDVNITRLRKKLGQYAQNIVTRQGFGYVFAE